MNISKLICLLLSFLIITTCFTACGKEPPATEDEDDLFSQGLLAVPAEKDGEVVWGYIKKNGKFAIEPRFESAYAFEKNGLACVKLNGKFGFINTSGEFVIPAQFDSFYQENFDESGVLPVNVGGKWGYIDLTGTYLAEPQFDYAEPFYNGMGDSEALG